MVSLPYRKRFQGDADLVITIETESPVGIKIYSNIYLN